ncbi:MAG: Rrf2 family transcriptional regulator [Deferribacterales bacterium]
MKITRASDYAIRVVLYLASQQTDRYYMRGDLADACSVPESFLGKLLQFLVKAEIIDSERGKRGGFKLKKAPEEITLYDIIAAVEGGIEINECLTDNDFCKVIKVCSIHSALNNVRENLINDLKSYTIKQLLINS